jgi:hypothetical protein
MRLAPGKNQPDTSSVRRKHTFCSAHNLLEVAHAVNPVVQLGV